MSFKKLDGDTAIIKNNGVYKECDLYEWDGKLFVAAAGGFLRLNRNGSTSRPNTFIDLIKIETPLFVDKFDRLCTAPAADRRPAIANTDGTIALLTG